MNNNNVSDLPNKQEATANKVMRNLAELSLDVAMYGSYAYNRGTMGVSVDGMKKMDFASDEKIHDMELIYQGELIMTGANK